MGIKMIILVVLGIMIGFSDLILAQESLLETEFIEREKRARIRYEAFFEHQKEQAANSKLREASREEHAVDRKRQMEAYEETRKEFVNNKGGMLVRATDDNYEAELLNRSKEYEQAREQYVKRRQAMEKLLTSLPQIPEEKDVGLD